MVEPENILKVYLSTIRPVLEYAIPIWQSIPDYLSDRVGSIQRRALRIIYPEAESYDQSLRMTKLETLASRRISLRTKYMNNIKASESHPQYKLPPRKHNIETLAAGSLCSDRFTCGLQILSRGFTDIIWYIIMCPYQVIIVSICGFMSCPNYIGSRSTNFNYSPQYPLISLRISPHVLYTNPVISGKCSIPLAF